MARRAAAYVGRPARASLTARTGRPREAPRPRDDFCETTRDWGATFIGHPKQDTGQPPVPRAQTAMAPTGVGQRSMAITQGPVAQDISGLVGAATSPQHSNGHVILAVADTHSRVTV